MASMGDSLDAIYWRDEVLQIMYWFRGEGLGEVVTARDLVTFLGVEEGAAGTHLERLVGDGYATRVDRTPTGYRLTELGVSEGGRRFADEFAGLTAQAHGECNNPACGCQTLGPEACQSRTVHAQ